MKINVSLFNALKNWMRNPGLAQSLVKELEDRPVLSEVQEMIHSEIEKAKKEIKAELIEEIYSTPEPSASESI